ncbi:hypothetical protein R50072_37010 [Simiduia litorea]
MRTVFIILIATSILGCATNSQVKVEYHQVDKACDGIECNYQIHVYSKKFLDMNGLYHFALDAILAECKAGKFTLEESEEEIVIRTHSNDGIVGHSLVGKFRCL